jgi:lactoylglutathione lyase
MLNATDLHHIALKVTNLDQTLTFYQKLGLEVLRRSTSSTTEGLSSAVVRVGKGEINIFSHTYMPTNTENSIGMHHFCLEMDCETIEDVIAELRQVGIDNFRGPKEFSDGTSVFVTDPDGIEVELRVARRG